MQGVRNQKKTLNEDRRKQETIHENPNLIEVPAMTRKVEVEGKLVNQKDYPPQSSISPSISPSYLAKRIQRSKSKSKQKQWSKIF